MAEKPDKLHPRDDYLSCKQYMFYKIHKVRFQHGVQFFYHSVLFVPAISTAYFRVFLSKMCRASQFTTDARPLTIRAVPFFVHPSMHFQILS
jgi:hypothetical protein